MDSPTNEKKLDKHEELRKTISSVSQARKTKDSLSFKMKYLDRLPTPPKVDEDDRSPLERIQTAKLFAEVDPRNLRRLKLSGGSSPSKVNNFLIKSGSSSPQGPGNNRKAHPNIGTILSDFVGRIRAEQQSPECLEEVLDQFGSGGSIDDLLVYKEESPAQVSRLASAAPYQSGKRLKVVTKGGSCINLKKDKVTSPATAGASLYSSLNASKIDVFLNDTITPTSKLNNNVEPIYQLPTALLSPLNNTDVMNNTKNRPISFFEAKEESRLKSRSKTYSMSTQTEFHKTKIFKEIPPRHTVGVQKASKEVVVVPTLKGINLGAMNMELRKTTPIHYTQMMNAKNNRDRVFKKAPLKREVFHN